MRPIGEIEPPNDPTERVKCWKCDTRFEVLRTVARATCPECGSKVALHRLNMPMLPSGKKKEGVVRLPKVGVPSVNARTRPLEMTVLENAGESVVDRPRGRVDDMDMDKKEEMGEAPPSLPAPFTARHKIEERRQMFTEAAPRMEGVEDGFEIPGITLKTLLAAIGLATLVLLAFIFALEN